LVTDCVSCPAGTYGATTGLTSSACSGDCAAGQFSAIKSSTCSLCTVSAGNYCPVKSTTKTGTPCTVGTFSAATGAVSSCAGLCPTGSYGAAGVVGMTTATDACTLCATGTYSDTAGQPSCTPCPTGSYSDALGSSSCTLCAAGTYADNTGLTTCADCTPGCACPSGSKQSCQTTCPLNYYSGPAQSTCTACPAGTYTATTKRTQVSDCLPCPLGQTSVSGFGCKTCSAPAGR
jgi:hypothetical protein